MYPQPKHGTLIEPFAGSAGYALRYPDHKVILVEKYDVIAEIWRFLTHASSAEILAIPIVEHVDDLPSGIPAGARNLVRFCFGAALAMPINKTSAGVRENRKWTDKNAGWSLGQRTRIARQVERIRHWQIIEGDYSLAPIRDDATYFIDPPYNNIAGRKYKAAPKGSQDDLDLWYANLGQWCQSLPGQVIVCENAGATWLPCDPSRSYRPQPGCPVPGKQGPPPGQAQG